MENGNPSSFWFVMRTFWDGDVYGSLDVPVIGRSKLLDRMVSLEYVVWMKVVELSD